MLTARWQTVCAAECGRPIQPGENMERAAAGEGWVHASCDPDAIPQIIEQAIASPACPHCWLERSADGSCGCGVPA